MKSNTLLLSLIILANIPDPMTSARTNRDVISDFLGDLNRANFTGCVSIAQGLVDDLRMAGLVLSTHNLETTTVYLGMEKKGCLMILDHPSLVEFLPGSLFFNTSIESEVSLAFVTESGHSLVILDTQDSSITEFWHPWLSAQKSTKILKTEFGPLSEMSDLTKMILKGDRDFRGQVLTALYDDWDPYSVVDTDTGKLVGGIFPAIFDTLAEKLNFTPK